MSKFKVGDRVRRLPEFRNAGGWDRGDAVMIVGSIVGSIVGTGWMELHGYSGFVSQGRFELVQDYRVVYGPTLARDDLYMRLLNDAKLTHQQALDFIKECGSFAAIRHALDNQPDTGHVMASLVIWTGDNEKAYREGARRCGWGY